jgi:hypothetical protein
MLKFEDKSGSLLMNNNGEYNYESTYSYGYDYSNANQNLNHAQNQNDLYNSISGAQSTSIYSNVHSQPQQLPYNPEMLLNNPAAQIGMQLGTQAFSAGQEYVHSNVITIVQFDCYISF